MEPRISLIVLGRDVAQSACGIGAATEVGGGQAMDQLDLQATPLMSSLHSASACD